MFFYFSGDGIMESKSVKLDISGMTLEQTLVQGPQLLQEIQLVARSVQSNLFANPDFKRLVFFILIEGSSQK